MERKAKIVATLGPSSENEEMLTDLIRAGLDVARLNFSHGTHQDHANRIAMIRRLSEKLDKPVTILQDLQGPKLRVGVLPREGIQLTKGQRVILTSLDESPDVDLNVEAQIIPMDVPNLSSSVKKGSRVLLDDGNLELEVISVGTGYLEARVVLEGVLTSHKGVNLPGAEITIPGFTEKDREDLQFGLSQGVDMVAISFVRSAHDVEVVRQAIEEYAPDQIDTPIIAKLERPEAVQNLHEILHAADGVMVARGDLAVETSPASVPIMQKKIIEAANIHARIVITATQMLDSMIHNPRPTRAEASDVANAIFDGTDAVMLSAETASGQYPLQSVKMMASIVREAELHFNKWGQCSTAQEPPTRDDAVSVTRAARELAHDRNVAGIVVFTQTGKTALLMSKARPDVPVLALTPEIDTYRRLSIMWNVVPIFVPYADSVESMLTVVQNALLAKTKIKPGQQVVVISGFPIGAIQPVNFALLHTVE